MQNYRKIKIYIRQSDFRVKMCFFSLFTITMCQKFFQNQNINWLKRFDHANYFLNFFLQNFIQIRSILNINENFFLIFEIVVFFIVHDDILMSIIILTTNDIKRSENINNLSNSIIMLNSQNVFIESTKSIDTSTIDNENENSFCHNFNSFSHEQQTYTIQSSENQIVDSNTTMTIQLRNNILFEILKIHVEIETSNEKIHFKLNVSNFFSIDCDQLCHFITIFFQTKNIKSTIKFVSMHETNLFSLSKNIDDNIFVATSDDAKTIKIQFSKYNNIKLSVATTTEKSNESNVCDDSILIIEILLNNIFISKRRVLIDINIKFIKCIKMINKREIKNKWKIHSFYTTLISNKAINVRWFERR